ncbi:gliding motility lipoprotein GldB [Dokdonia sp. Hel_I_53]|uniref:gliding motility lipoprotein GldB n=1 Tax=Dokdonia sp. Hel_I_53 TaxID=1566287 RepID=UPI0011994BC5|nr:gliding motility lipoprotein GldB [Dokdonia sp. Hel_I_53]TVZ52007.1 protein involved in gliding motility GldB [Dokdonia sp. Hel_I_53]
MKNLLMLFLLSVFFLGCAEEVKIPSEIENQPVDMEVVRFDKEFAAATNSDLSELTTRYPYLFSKKYPDEYWYQKFKDTIQLELNTEVLKEFPDFKEEKESLQDLFKHITYYYPQVTVPKIITITSEVDYRNKVVLADSLLVIALDTYLGAEHHFYTGIPRFQSKNFRKEQIDVDVAAIFVKGVVSKPKNIEFLSEMIYEGKKLFAMKRLLTLKPEYEIMGYTKEELNFAQQNERNIWEYFIKKELLYSTDRKLLSRFMNPAPFSKFYLEFDNETPGRIARFIGFEIVKSYMENNDVPLKTMLIQDAATIFAAAKYKP